VGIELVGGILANSLALVADAGHMATDAAALGLSLWAARLAVRPASPERTYGWVRAEILAALANGAAILAIAGWIAWEAWGRLAAPVEIDGPLMVGVAIVGLLVNVIVALLLHRDAAHSLNVRGAYLHVLGDLLGSVGALTAGLVILLTGWAPADPLVSLLISGLLVIAAWRLMKEASHILLESAPPHVDVPALGAELAEIPGLSDIHDLHVWTLTSGLVALSGHGISDEPAEYARLLDDVRTVAAGWGIAHVTFQLEPRKLVQLGALPAPGSE